MKISITLTAGEIADALDKCARDHLPLPGARDGDWTWRREGIAAVGAQDEIREVTLTYVKAYPGAGVKD